MKKLYYHLFIILLTISFMACEVEDGLPKATQTGVGMIAAKINGKPWQQNSSWSVMHGDGLDVSYSSKGFVIYGSREADDFDNMVTIMVTDMNNLGSYTLKEEASNSYASVFDYKERNNTKRYYTTATSTGTVTITKLDTKSKIISGTFSFRAQNRNNPSESLEVTDGRFDVKYD